MAKINCRKIILRKFTWNCKVFFSGFSKEFHCWYSNQDEYWIMIDLLSKFFYYYYIYYRHGRQRLFFIKFSFYCWSTVNESFFLNRVFYLHMFTWMLLAKSVIIYSKSYLFDNVSTLVTVIIFPGKCWIRKKCWKKRVMFTAEFAPSNLFDLIHSTFYKKKLIFVYVCLLDKPIRFNRMFFFLELTISRLRFIHCLHVYNLKCIYWICVIQLLECVCVFLFVSPDSCSI